MNKIGEKNEKKLANTKFSLNENIMNVLITQIKSFSLIEGKECV